MLETYIETGKGHKGVWVKPTGVKNNIYGDTYGIIEKRLRYLVSQTQAGWRLVTRKGEILITGKWGDDGKVNLKPETLWGKLRNSEIRTLRETQSKAENAVERPIPAGMPSWVTGYKSR